MSRWLSSLNKKTTQLKNKLHLYHRHDVDSNSSHDHRCCPKLGSDHEFLRRNVSAWGDNSLSDVEKIAPSIISTIDSLSQYKSVDATADKDCCEAAQLPELLYGSITAHMKNAEDLFAHASSKTLLQEYPYSFHTSPFLSEDSASNSYLIHEENDNMISQNSSKRKVLKYMWKSPKTNCLIPAAVKFVSDQNNRDGRSLKREIECHIYARMKLAQLHEMEQKLHAFHQSVFSYTKMDIWAEPTQLIDSWPCSELIAYHVDKGTPGNSVLITRRLKGPDFFDVIRGEHNHSYKNHSFINGDQFKCCYYMQEIGRPNYLKRKHGQYFNYSSCDPRLREHFGYASQPNTCEFYPESYNYFKLRWAALALKRLSQYHSINVRHNDVKPDNVMCDFFRNEKGNFAIDVKLIDLGTASLAETKDFTGGTSWYESPEQKLLEYYGKKKQDTASSERVNISLTSDAWGAGIALTEVLIGKRVVDSYKNSKYSGPLEYLGADLTVKSVKPSSSLKDMLHNSAASHLPRRDSLSEHPYWRVRPDDWVAKTKEMMFLPLTQTWQNSTLLAAAEWLFENMVRTKSSSRYSAESSMHVIEQFAEEEYQKIRYFLTSFRTPRYEKNFLLQQQSMF